MLVSFLVLKSLFSVIFGDFIIEIQVLGILSLARNDFNIMKYTILSLD